MLEYDFENSVGYWLTHATQAYHRAFSEQLTPQGITYRQAQVLCWLALEQKMTVAQLAAKMIVEPPTLVGILDRMERNRWIKRVHCETDRRRKWIVATPAANPVWKKIVECGNQMRQTATQGISTQELKTLKRVLKKIQQNVSAELAVSNRTNEN